MTQQNNAQDNGPVDVPLLQCNLNNPDLAPDPSAAIRDSYQSPMYASTAMVLALRLLSMIVGPNHRLSNCKSSQLRHTKLRIILCLLMRSEIRKKKWIHQETHRYRRRPIQQSAMHL